MDVTQSHSYRRKVIQSSSTCVLKVSEEAGLEEFDDEGRPKEKENFCSTNIFLMQEPFLLMVIIILKYPYSCILIVNEIRKCIISREIDESVPWKI